VRTTAPTVTPSLPLGLSCTLTLHNYLLNQPCRMNTQSQHTCEYICRLVHTGTESSSTSMCCSTAPAAPARTTCAWCTDEHISSPTHSTLTAVTWHCSLASPKPRLAQQHTSCQHISAAAVILTLSFSGCLYSPCCIWVSSPRRNQLAAVPHSRGTIAAVWVTAER